MHEISIDQTELTIDDSPYHIGTLFNNKLKTKYLTARLKQSYFDNYAFNGKNDKIYTAFMLMVGDKKNTIDRKMLTIINLYSDIGGLKEGLSVIVFLISYIFFRPIEC